MNNAWRSILVTGIAAVALVGCGTKQSSEPTTSGATMNTTVASPAATDANARHSALFAAAEPFEVLTEQAATATPTALDKLVADARSAAKAVLGSLDQAQQGTLNSKLADIAAAQKSNDRTSVALAAVEGYRTLIESAPDAGPTPREVSLLDYAGFRYQANLAAKPARWADASAAVDFADAQWATLSPKVADASLRNNVSRSIADMRKAAQGKNAILAKSASTAELDLVDKLEASFTTKK